MSLPTGGPTTPPAPAPADDGRRRVLAALVSVPIAFLGATLDARGAQPIALDLRTDAGVEPSRARALELGFTFGLDEAAHTARLLGREVVRGAGSAASGFTVSADAESVTLLYGSPGCAFRISPTPERREAALRAWRSRNGSAGTADFTGRPGIAEWHPSLGRLGASELNERFMRAARTAMSAPAWLGWVAVKVAAEAMLRDPAREACEALRTVRLDGHKGRPLTFDARTRELSQPLYVVLADADGDRVVGEIDPWKPGGAGEAVS